MGSRRDFLKQLIAVPMGLAAVEQVLQQHVSAEPVNPFLAQFHAENPSDEARLTYHLDAKNITELAIEAETRVENYSGDTWERRVATGRKTYRLRALIERPDVLMHDARFLRVNCYGYQLHGVIYGSQYECRPSGLSVVELQGPIISLVHT